LKSETQHKQTKNYSGTEVTCVCFYLSRAHELLSRAHDIISQLENIKYIPVCLKLADSRTYINILYYILMQNADISVPKYTYIVDY